MIVHFHSFFSLRYGMMSPEEIVQRCESEAMSMRQKVPILLADINNVSGVSNYLRAARDCKHILPLVGCDIRNGDRHLYLLLCESQSGFASMNGFLSDHLMGDRRFPEVAPQLSGVRVVYPIGRLWDWEKDFGDSADGGAMISAWGFAVPWRQLDRLRLWKKSLPMERLLAVQTVTVRDEIDFETHKLLRCIDHNCLLSKLPEGATAEPWQQWQPLRQIFSKFVAAKHLITQAQAFCEGCAWTFEWNIQQNKKTFTGDPNQDFRMLRELASEGLHYRYPNYTFETTQRLEKEMQMIYQLGFTSYFLINWDICRFARENNFFYVGRGSGANSMVAYCLRITDVDPIDLDLYFERFINPHRSSPPDFDLDFSWQDRDHVTAYILEKYKAHGAALVATYSTFQTNAVVRELGKVYGLPKAEIDALLNKTSYYSHATFEAYTPSKGDVYAQPGVGHGIRNRTLGRSGGKATAGPENPVSAGDSTSAGHANTARTSTAVSVVSQTNGVSETREDDHPSLYQELLKHAHRIHNLPNHLSIHVGGILIPEKHIHHYSATFLPPKGFPVVQFSLLEAEDLGIAKFDILSQRGLGHIKDAVVYVQQNQGISVDAHQIHAFKNDPVIQRLIETGHTTGCFYVESPAMRQLLRKLKCKDYLTLVAASSVIRPGVARSGMMRAFIERHVDPAKRSEAHPVLWDLMPETYGIMVYQEDVIKVAHHFAGIGLGESDVLRRGMSGKFRSREEFQKVKDAFFASALKKGHKPELVSEVWHQIESFAGYSFAKGHSASYAVESYQSLYLKAHYPLEFYTAVINNFGGFYRTEFYVHAARKSGATIEAPCINESEILTRIQGKTLWLGLGLIDGLEQQCVRKLLSARDQAGPFSSLSDFKQRVEPGLEQLKILIHIGACRSWQRSRKALLWEAHALYASKKAVAQTEKLFLEPTKEYQLPSLEDSWLEVAHDERNLLGFSLGHPFQLIQGAPYPHDPSLPHLSKIRSKHFQQMLHKNILIEGYLVTVKPTKTVGGKEMNFGTWLDADGHYFDSIHFPPSLSKSPFNGRGVYRMWGKITEDYGVFNIEVSRMVKIPYQPDPRFVD